MTTLHKRGENTAERGEALYRERLRHQVETPENIGKLISIDVESGDYELGSDLDIEAPLRLYARHPDAIIYTLRIGYQTPVVIGGILERSEHK